MPSAERRKELTDDFREQQPEAGIYRIVNSVTGRSLVASTPNLPSIRNRIAFGLQTGNTGVFDRRLDADLRAHGVASFSLEVLETVAPDPTRTPAQLRAELATLLELWRENIGPANLYA